jgi:hypothetical protein
VPTTSSFSPERLVAEEFGIGSGQPYILQHPIIERRQLPAFADAPTPFAHGADKMMAGVAQCLNRIVPRSTISRLLPVDGRHLKSPNVGERRKSTRPNFTLA